MARAVTSAVRASAPLLLGAALAGCSELIGTDEYATAEAELPYHGFFDRLGGAKCRECMQSSCQAPFAECQAEPACKGYFDCVTTHPGMQAACRAPVSFELMDLGARVAGCWTECAAACNAGRSWSCNRAFEPLVPEPGVSEARALVSYVNALDGLPLEGIDVRACRRNDVDCLAPQSAPAPPTDEKGRTTVLVNWPPKSPLSPLPGFDGYLELTSKTIQPQWWPMLRFTNGREVGDWSDPAVMFNGNDPNVKLVFALQTGIQIDTSLSGFAVEVHDCLGTPAPGIRFEVTLDGSEKEVALVYTDAQGDIDPSLDLTTTSGLAFGANLEGQVGKVVARFAESGEVLRESAFVLRAGATHSVAIHPGPKLE